MIVNAPARSIAETRCESSPTPASVIASSERPEVFCSIAVDVRGEMLGEEDAPAPLTARRRSATQSEDGSIPWCTRRSTHHKQVRCPPKGAATPGYGDSLLPSKPQVLLQSQRMSQNVTACGLSVGQRGCEIFNQVVTRFESHRQAHQSVADSCASPIRRRHPGMRGGRGPGYQRLDASETWRIDRNRHAIDKASRR